MGSLSATFYVRESFQHGSAFHVGGPSAQNWPAVGTSCLEGTADALTFSAAASQASDDSSDTLAPTSELNRKSLFSGSVTMPQRSGYSSPEHIFEDHKKQQS